MKDLMILKSNASIVYGYVYVDAYEGETLQQ